MARCRPDSPTACWPIALEHEPRPPHETERDLEDALVTHISKFLIELGAGFAYVGRQVPLEIHGRDFFVDLLFYHLRLRCFVVVELKAGEFAPTPADPPQAQPSDVVALRQGAGSKRVPGCVTLPTHTSR